MAQGEIWVERQNWARWPRVLNVNRRTDHGTETRRYLPEQPWSEREYAVGKIAELKSENAKLRELCKELLDLCYDAYNQEWGWDDDWALAYEQAKKLGVNDG